jgi:hypothetical protein
MYIDRLDGKWATTPSTGCRRMAQKSITVCSVRFTDTRRPISPTCEPSSELHIAEDWYRRTALSALERRTDRYRVGSLSLSGLRRES